MTKPIAFCFLAFVGILTFGVCSDSLSAKSFEVQDIGGVPAICIDGQPVRGRVFYGGFGIQKTALKPNEWNRIRFEFQPQIDSEGRGTVHFRLGRLPGRVILDNIELWNVTDNQPVAGPYRFDEVGPAIPEGWRIWPPKNDVGTVQTIAGLGEDGSAALVVDLKRPSNGIWPDFHVYHVSNLPLDVNKTYRFSCQIWTDVERTASIAFYKPGNPYVFLGGPGESFQEQIKLAGAVGVNFVTFPISAVWREGEKAKAEYDAIESACRYVLKSNPKALLLPRISMNAPDWFLAENPGEKIVRWDKNGVVTQGECLNYAASASKKYRKLAAAALERTVRFLQKTFGDSYAGCHPCGQNTGEWFTPRSWNHDRPGYSEAERAGFREFVARKYPTDAALQTAWGDSSVTRMNADVPSMKLWSDSEKQAILNPVFAPRFQQIIDFNLFVQESMADLVLDLAAAARQGSGAEKRLVLFFYGYTFEFTALGDGAAKSAHYQLERILKSPDIDIYCSPMSYFDRQPGGFGHAMTAAETVTRAGKIYLYEDDTRTFLTKETDFPGWESGSTTLEGTQNLLLRNTSQAALRNFATWWMDLGSSGWFNSPELWSKMDQLKAMDQYFLDHPTPFEPEIGAIIDESSLLYSSNNWVSKSTVYEARKPLGRAGAPFGQYLLSDLIAGRVPDRCKLFVVLAARRLSQPQRDQLRAALKGKTVLWLYEPGRLPDARSETADNSPCPNICALTDFDVRSAGKRQPLSITDAGQKAGLSQPWDAERTIDFITRYSVKTKPDDEVWATYPNGAPAVVFRRAADGLQAIYCGVPQLSAELVRAAALRAGAHLYADNDCNACANGPYITLHASRTGMVNIDTGKPGTIVDYLTGQNLGLGPKLRLNITEGETRILEIK